MKIVIFLANKQKYFEVKVKINTYYNLFILITFNAIKKKCLSLKYEAFLSPQVNNESINNESINYNYNFFNTILTH